MKYKLKNIVITVIAIFVMFSLIGVILCFSLIGKPTSVSAEKISEILVSYDLQPMDITASAYDNFQGAGLEKCIVAEDGDMRFEFYIFDNSGNARRVYQEAHAIIVTTKMDVPRVQIEYGKIGYRYYSLTAGGNYSVTTYVDNTAIYAYCSEENQSKTVSILDDIGYVDTKPKQETPFWATGAVRVVNFILYIPMALVARSFYWKAAYKSAGVTSNEIEAEEKKRKELFGWLVDKSPNIKTTKIFLAIYRYFLLPVYACIILAIIGCFTSMLQILNALGVALPFAIIVVGIIGATMEKRYKKN